MIKELQKCFDPEWLKKHVLELYRIERKQTSRAWISSADYTYSLLVDEGFEAERISFPADGIADYQDKRTPIGWDCTRMTLSLLTPVAGISNPLISDYSREPLEAVKHSVSTPDGGIDAEVITESQMKAGADVRGAFVLLDVSTRPRGEAMRMLLDLGAIGWISDYTENPLRSADTVAWINAGCEYNAWHVQADDRDFISYQVSPKTGFYLRKACESGSVKVHAESDGKRYVTELPAVTAILKGEDPREFWLCAHLYEPLIDDDSNGVIGSIAILKALRQMRDEGKIRLRYSVRVVFASEMYGFAAFADFMGNMSGRAIGGMNMDGTNAGFDKTPHWDFRKWPAPDYNTTLKDHASVGNIMLDETALEMQALYPQVEMGEEPPHLHDDCFLSDPTVGVPMMWLYHTKKGFHHNSIQDEKMLDIEGFVINLAFQAALAFRMTTTTEKEVREILPRAVDAEQHRLALYANSSVRPGSNALERMQFLLRRSQARIRSLKLYADIPEIESAANSLVLPEFAPAPAIKERESRPAYAAASRKSWYDYAADFFFVRKTAGFPYDMNRMPRKERVLGSKIEGEEFYALLTHMLPGLSFRDVITQTEWNWNIVFSESAVKKYLLGLLKLAEAGYLDVEIKHPESADSLAKALRELGVKEGDTLLVHSSLSGLGYIPGGAETVLQALQSVLGENGTFAVPAFTRPYIAFEGSVNKSRVFRPYDTRPDGSLRDAAISTGILPQTVAKHPDAARSGHISHEWAAMGKNAEALVSGHGFLDPPTGDTSPLANALKCNGSVVFLGCSISSNTFLHYVETVFDAPFLAPAVMKYIDKNGRLHTAFIEKHLPGDRDFYHDPSCSDFYTEAVRRGLTINAVPFGMATLYRMDLRQLYEIAADMFREDPCATLCKNPKCRFCSDYRTR